MQAVLQANLLAPMLLTQALLPHLLRQPRAQVVFVGSALGRIGLPGFSVYGASKAGLHGFAEALRRELADTAGAGADPRPAQHAHRLQRRRRRGLQPRHRHRDGHAREAVAAALLALIESERRRALPRLPRAPGRAPERPARRAARRQLRQAPPQPAPPPPCNRSPRRNTDMNKLPLGLLRPVPLAAARWPPRPRAGGRRGDRTAARLGSDPLPDAGRRAREALRGAGRARRTRSARAYPGRSEPLVWEGIIVSSLGRREGRPGRARPGQAGQGAVRAGDPDRRQGARRLGLQQPGRAVLQGAGLAAGLRRQGQGARSCCRRRWRSTRRASTRTSSTASTWSRPSTPSEAVTYLERALQAPPRPGRQIADTGRREEVRALLAKIRPQLSSADHAPAVGAGRGSAAPGRAARRCAARSTRPGRCRSRPGRRGGGSVRPGAPASRPAAAGRRSRPPGRRRVKRSVDGAAFGRVAHGVVEQVAQQHGQQVGVAAQRQGRRALRRPVAAQFDAAALGQRQHVAHHLLDERRPVHRARAAAAGRWPPGATAPASA